MKLLVHAQSLSSAGGENRACMCVGPIVGQESVHLELDSASSFMRRSGLLMAVADTGPDDWGVLASQILVEELSERFYATADKGTDASALRVGVGQCLDDANQALLSRLADEERVSSATSLSGVALLEGNVAVIFHIGNCRVLRDSGGYLRPLTTDHVEERTTVKGRLYEGSLVEVADPDVTRFIGILGSGVPDIRMLTWAIGDTFLTGSKGWHGVASGVAADAVKTAMNAYYDLGSFVGRTLQEAHRVDGKFNSTLIAARIER